LIVCLASRLIARSPRVGYAFSVSTLNPFLIMGYGKQWKPAAMLLFVTCYMGPTAARAKEVASVPLLGPYGRHLRQRAGSELMVPSNRLAAQRTAGRHKEIKRIPDECPACPKRRTAR
jgi:hypothetical protein